MIDLQYYSPVQQIHNPLFTEKEVQVFVKRDDMIHPFISGNKWRKLKYILHEAETLNKKHLVTFGGAYSNHLLATACAAAKFGFKSTGIVRGEPVQNDQLMLCHIFDMELRFTDRKSYRNKRELFEKGFQNDPDAFFIDEGGAGIQALRGCAELIDELTDQYDHIFCAAGTGTTAAGIISGIQKHALQTKTHVIPVLKGGDFLIEEIKKYGDTQIPFEFHPDYHFGGYAKTTRELLSFIQHFSRKTGILIDPVYTGKMFFAIFDLIGKDQFLPGSKILALHTGGLFGILGMSEKFKQA